MHNYCISETASQEMTDLSDSFCLLLPVILQHICMCTLIQQSSQFKGHKITVPSHVMQECIRRWFLYTFV